VGLYAVTLGITVTWLLDIANIAHPVFVIQGARPVMHTTVGLDPILAGAVHAAVFALGGGLSSLHQL
jgi:hypothetical protein